MVASLNDGNGLAK